MVAPEKEASIIAKLKSKYWQRSNKYGIRIPKTVEEALQIDKDEGSTLWPAFQLCKGDTKVY